MASDGYRRGYVSFAHFLYPLVYEVYLYPLVYEVYRGYIVFAFSVCVCVCVCVCV